MTERDYVICKTDLQVWLGGQAQSSDPKEPPFDIRVKMAAVKAHSYKKALEHIVEHKDWMCYAHIGDEHDGDCAVATARKALGL